MEYLPWQKQIVDGGRGLSKQEIEAINIFKQADQPYSLMFEILIEKFIQN